MIVAFCLPGYQYSGRFLSNWTNLTESLRQNGIDYVLKQKSASMVHYARMGCLEGDPLFGQRQIPFQGKLPYDYLMWIDSDIDFAPENFYQLLRMDRPISTGLYKMQNFQTNHSEYAAKLLGDPNHITNRLIEEKGIQNSVVPLEFSGMGWMLIKRGVIESMQYPWFRSDCVTQIIPDTNMYMTGLTSEDHYFCQEANKLGYGVWAHTGCVVGHEKTIVLR